MTRERRFVIREIYEGEDPKSIYWVTESELKRRLVLMFSMFNNENDWPNVLPIFLHGEGEKGEVSKSDIAMKIVRDKLDERFGKPSPTPSRQEWEAWAKRFATSIKDRHFFTVDDIAERILSMPGVPKG